MADNHYKYCAWASLLPDGSCKIEWITPPPGYSTDILIVKSDGNAQPEIGHD